MDKMILTSVSIDELKEIFRDVIKEELDQKKEKELMSFKETCQYLGISMSTLNKWKSQNRIPYKRLGKRIFFNRSEVVEALKDSNYFKIKELIK